MDSYRFLPRSFIPLYSAASPAPGDDGPVWAPFEKRLAEAQIALLTSAGLYLEGEQPPFDAEREKAEPTWGDPTHRVLPAPLDAAGARHDAPPHQPRGPAGRSRDRPSRSAGSPPWWTRAGWAPSPPRHVSVMGYQQAGLEVWRRETAPAIVELLRDQGTDGLILAPV